MSSPHMSGRDDDPLDERPGRDPGDLLDENGKVDLTRIAEITNAPDDMEAVIDPEKCGEIRADLLAGRATAAEYTSILGVDKSTVRRHARGRCHHIEARVDTPPVVFNNQTREYEVDE